MMKRRKDHNYMIYLAFERMELQSEAKNIWVMDENERRMDQVH